MMNSLADESFCSDSNICYVVWDYYCTVFIDFYIYLCSFCHVAPVLSLYDRRKLSEARSTYAFIYCLYLSAITVNIFLLYRFLEVSVVDYLENVLMPSIEPIWALIMP